MKFSPNNFVEKRVLPEKLMRRGWRTMDMLVVSLKDKRLTWPELEFVQHLGDRLYGKRKTDGGRHG